MVTATMKPKVSTKLAGQAEAAAGGSSLFKMNLLHWTETLYQKLEKACTESEVVQAPCRYVDVVSDRIKHVLDELNDYVNPYDDLSDETESSDVSKGCTVVESYLSSMVDEGSSHHQNICETDSSDVAEVYMESTVELSEPDSSDVSEVYMESTVELSETDSSTVELSETDSSTVELSEVYRESTVELSETDSSTVELSEVYMESTVELSEPDSSDLSEDCIESMLESNVSSGQNIHEPDSLESTVESDVEEDEGLSESQNIHMHEEDMGLSQSQNIPIHVEDEVLSQNIHEPDSLSTLESNVSFSEDLKFPNRTEEDSNIHESVNFRKTIGSKISDENAENIKNAEHIVSSSGPEQELSLVTSSGPEQELSRQIRRDKYGSADVTNFLESSYNITPSESHENELIEERSIGPDTTSSIETHESCISQETESLLQSLTDERDQQHDLNKANAPERLSETETDTKISDDDTIIPTRVLMDSFEDVNLNTCWEDVENFELVVTPNHVSKESPEKMKLRHIFISKVLAAKRNKQVKNQSYVNDIEINAQSSNSTEDSCGSDWVLL